MEQKSFIIQKSEIEQELIDLLKEHNSPFNLEDIKEIIYDEEESDDLMKVVRIFDRGGDAGELDNILELASDAWNHFPHKALGGLSPQEITKNQNSRP